MNTAALLLAGNTTEAAPSGGIAQLGLFAVFGLALYFMLVRPQQKRQKAQQALLAELTPGLDVVTVGGLHATIAEVSDTWVDLQVTGDGVILRFQRQAIASIVKAQATADEDSE